MESETRVAASARRCAIHGKNRAEAYLQQGKRIAYTKPLVAA